MIATSAKKDIGMLSLTDGSEPAVPSVPTHGYFPPIQKACPSHFLWSLGMMPCVSTCIILFSQNTTLTGEKKWFPRPKIKGLAA